MGPLDSSRRPWLDELANALQAVVLIAEHLERSSAYVAQDAKAVTKNLQRVTTALEKLRGIPPDRP
jgi:hypothetical protein